VWPTGVVVDALGREHNAGVGERAEQGLVQKLISQATVEALDEGILTGLPGDVMPGDLVIVSKAQDHR